MSGAVVFPICPYCKREIRATIHAAGHPPVPFCGCKKSQDAALANLKKRLAADRGSA